MDLVYEEIADTHPVRGALARLGLKGPTASTILVHASAIANASPAEAWKVWEDVEKWTVWGAPFISRSRWLERRQWEVGAKFELVRHFGFPVGRQVTVETVREVNPGASAAWWDGDGGMRSCQMWQFELMADGRTRIHRAEVLCGFIAFFAKPFVTRRLNRRSQAMVDALAKAIEKSKGL